jgi:formate hydrogenlyase transcriptional activator
MSASESHGKAGSTSLAKAEGMAEARAGASAGNEAGDVRERRQTREDLEKALNGLKQSEFQLRKIIDAIPTVAWCTFLDGSLEFVNQRWHDYTGTSAQAASGFGYIPTIHPEDLDRVMEKSAKLRAEGKPGEIEGRLRRYDGEYRWFLFRLAPLRDETGKIVRWCGTNTDIESVKQAEEKLKEALKTSKESELQLRKTLNTIPTLAWSVLPDGPSDFINQRWYDYTGLSVEEALGYGWKAAIHPEDLDHVVDTYMAHLTSGKPCEIEARLRRHDGEYRWFLIRIEPLHDPAGNIVRWYGTNTDIDDLKKAQVKLRQDEEELRRITDAIPQFIITWDSGGNAFYVNRALFDYTGVAIEGLSASDFRSRVVHPEDVARLRDARQGGFSRGLPFEVEQRVLRKDGQYRWFLIQYNPLLDENGKIVRWYGTGTDIDDRKRSEDRTLNENLVLREEDTRLRKIIDTIPALAWCCLPDGSHDFGNQRWSDYTGLSPEDAHGYGWGVLFPPQDREDLVNRFLALMAAGEPGEVEARLRRHDGEYRWFLIRFSPLRDGMGNIVRWYGTNTDIEALKQTEQKLEQALNASRESEEQLKETLDTIPTAAWYCLPDGSNQYVSERWLAYTGLPAEEARGNGWKATIHSEDLDRAMKQASAILASGEPGEIEERVRRHDGEYRWFLVRYAPLRDEMGKIVRWYGTNTDIQVLKQTEEKLRQDEHELRKITDAIPQLIATLNPDGTLLYVNQALLDYFGFSREDAVKSDLRLRTFHPEDIERVRDERQAALARGLPFELEQRILRKDGQYRWFLVSYHPFRDEDGRLVRWYTTGTDIDDRKRSEDRTRNENLALREEVVRSSMFEEIIGSSPALRRVLAQVSKVAPTDSTVLILGESGTGKELIARAIHNRSQRSSRAFIRVNLAAIPPSLIASELFGHEKGSFTGALQRRPGRFEQADGGTLFLDEIGEPPAETQVALLRVLQEREFERVGGNQTVSVDVRVIAATNRDLGAAVTEGRFREDLFYRLNVFPIRLPALRERGDDVRLLVEYLIDRYAQKAGKTITNISQKTLDLFRTYDWPGNIRELQNVIERAVVLCEGGTFSVDETWLTRSAPRSTVISVPLVADLVEREKEIIESALRQAEGVIGGPSGAAVKLGLPRQTLESKIRKLGINRYRFKT